MAGTIEMTEEEYRRLCNDDAGICLACNEITEGGVEPDAEGYECDACGENEVCGIEWALTIEKIDITE